MKHVLVTGGAGYIGSYICKLFYDKGYIPVTFDNLSLGNKWSVKWGPLEVGELCSENDDIVKLSKKVSSLFKKKSNTILPREITWPINTNKQYFFSQIDIKMIRKTYENF